MEQTEYYVWRRPAFNEPFRVVRREVHTRTRKGYPITYMLKSIPAVFETWDKAQFVANKLNLEILQGNFEEYPEEEVQGII